MISICYVTFHEKLKIVTCESYKTNWVILAMGRMATMWDEICLITDVTIICVNGSQLGKF